MKLIIQALSLTTVILVGSVSALTQTKPSTQAIKAEERTLLSPSSRMIEQGRTVAATACAKCHGMDGMKIGEGQPYLAGQRAVYLYRVLRSYQNSDRENNSMRHASGYLNDEATLVLAAYYASLTPDRKTNLPGMAEEPEPFEDNPFTGIQATIKKCTKCHGATGNSTASGMPNMTAQDPEYFVTSMQAYVDGSRNHKLMKKLVSALDGQTIDELGVYYAVQQPERTETMGDGDADAGSALAEQCANCHGADGNAGAANMPTLAGQDARYFIKAMQAYKENRRSHVPMSEAVEKLSETQIKNLAAFYAEQMPLRRNIRIPFTTAEWMERCERCHGRNGNSTDPRFPMLAGQNEEYLRNAMQAYSTESRPGSVMHAMSSPLSETDIERMVSYYASQEPQSVVYIQLPCEDAGTD